jgi:hypothetical protein
MKRSALRSGIAHQSEPVRRLLLLWAARRLRPATWKKSVELWRKAGEVRQEDFESPLLQAQSMRKLGLVEESRP